MSKLKRGRDVEDASAQDEYISDGGFVEDDNEVRSKKKTKTMKSAIKGPDSEEPMWELSSSSRASRRVTISMLGKTRLVNIREYYEKDGQLLPGKKGISLTIEQYNSFIAAVPGINATLKDLGEKVRFSETGVQDTNGQEKVQKTVKKKSSKANIEATSDEEED